MAVCIDHAVNHDWETKSVSGCSHCITNTQVRIRDVTVPFHGPRDNPCRGSKRLPLAVSSTLRTGDGLVGLNVTSQQKQYAHWSECLMTTTSQVSSSCVILPPLLTHISSRHEWPTHRVWLASSAISAIILLVWPRLLGDLLNFSHELQAQLKPTQSDTECH